MCGPKVGVHMCVPKVDAYMYLKVGVCLYALYASEEGVCPIGVHNGGCTPL